MLGSNEKSFMPLPNSKPVLLTAPVVLSLLEVLALLFEFSVVNMAFLGEVTCLLAVHLSTKLSLLMLETPFGLGAAFSPEVIIAIQASRLTISTKDIAFAEGLCNIRVLLFTSCGLTSVDFL